MSNPFISRTSRYAEPTKMPNPRNLMSASYVRRKIKRASERGRRMANRRWELDRAMRSRLANQELERRKRLVVILRDNSTGEERVIPWNDETFHRLRSFAESSDL